MATENYVRGARVIIEVRGQQKKGKIIWRGYSTEVKGLRIGVLLDDGATKYLPIADVQLDT